MAGMEPLEIVRADDFVEYLLFPTVDSESAKCLTNYMESLLKHINDLVKPHTENYIWHKDEFQLVIRNTGDFPAVDNTEELPPHLYGVTHYGENIEDEWFIVHLLTHLTKSINGLIARVVDSDGEFLLIEAADFLPKWASPEICERRVYISNGEVHVVPPEDEDETISVVDALSAIKERPGDTSATPNVQSAIANRIKGYPEKVLELLHHTNAMVPSSVAAILQQRPSLIAPAITAFCHRDVIDNKACRAMRYFPPETCVMTRVKMSRCQYAMLLHTRYIPDRKTGWNLPQQNSPDYPSHSLGVKIACGFEILVSQSKDKEDDLEIDNDKDWLRYKKSLVEKGYFKDLLEGSKEYNRLEKQAKEYYRSNTVHEQKSIGRIVMDMLNSLDYDLEDLKRRSMVLPPPDEESWMEMSSEDLDKMLTERYGAPPASGSSSSIPHHLNTFLNHISSIDGVDHPNHTSESVPMRPRRNKNKKKKKELHPQPQQERDDDNNRISFDPDSFSCALNNILDLIVPEDKWGSDESGMSGYEDEAEMDLSNKKSNGGERTELKQYMDQMDRELASTTLGQSFLKKQAGEKGMEDSFSDIESFKPVDIDMNALKNILRSYEEEMGGAGPASTMLGPMGVSLYKPPESDQKP